MAIWLPLVIWYLQYLPELIFKIPIMKVAGALSDYYTSLSTARMAKPYEIAAPYFKQAA